MNDMDEDEEQARSPIGAAQLRLRRLLEKVPCFSPFSQL
jgi:hypothetical protein